MCDIEFDDSLSLKELKQIKGKISLGLCCINNQLREQKNPVFCSRSLIRRTFTIEKAQQLALQNVSDISKLIKWNVDNGIDHLRLSSDMFPHINDPETSPYTLDFAKEALQQAGECAKCYKHRITFHPGQYTVLSSNNENVLDQSFKDLQTHTDILDIMGIDDTGIVNIHGGGIYNDKEGTIRRWVDNFDDLPRSVKNRLSIENDERNYNIVDCIEIAEACKIKFVLDSHHHDCYGLLHPEEKQYDIKDYMEQIINTWQGQDPTFHVSEQRPNSRVGAHSDYVEAIPNYMLRIPLDYNCRLHIELEAKQKEKSIQHLKQNYKTIFM
jgi:UV DNA damage endonuclease